MTSTYPFQLIADALDSARITAGLIDVAGITAGLGGLADAAGITAGLGGLADAAGITAGLGRLADTMGLGGQMAELVDAAGITAGLGGLADAAGITKGLGRQVDAAGITMGLGGLADAAGITMGLGRLADAAGITAGLGGLADAAGITIGLREQMAATMGIWTKDLQFAGDIADRLRNNTTSDIGIDPTFSLTRSQQRFLFGLYIYILVSSLVLWTLLDIMIRNSEADSAALTLIISMTGLSSHAVARKAREMAYQVFDQIYPNEK